MAIRKIRVKKGGEWHTPIQIFKKIDGIWQEFRKAYTKVDGTWRIIFEIDPSEYVFTDDLLWTENFWRFLLTEDYEPLVVEVGTDETNAVDQHIDQIVDFGGHIVLTEDITAYLEREEDDSPLLVEDNNPETEVDVVDVTG